VNEEFLEKRKCLTRGVFPKISFEKERAVSGPMHSREKKEGVRKSRVEARRWGLRKEEPEQKKTTGEPGCGLGIGAIR